MGSSNDNSHWNTETRGVREIVHPECIAYATPEQMIDGPGIVDRHDTQSVAQWSTRIAMSAAFASHDVTLTSGLPCTHSARLSDDNHYRRGPSMTVLSKETRRNALRVLVS